jgi:hypothetical protein
MTEDEKRMKAREELMRIKAEIDRKSVRAAAQKVMKQYRDAVKSLSKK